MKAAQLLEQYGLRASDVPASDGRLSAKDVEDYVRAKASHRDSESGRAGEAVAAAAVPDQ